MFTPRSSRGVYCNKNKTSECPVCGIRFEYKCCRAAYKKYCSNKCVGLSPETREKVKQTTLDRYGVENPMHLDKFKQKAMDSQIKKFGKFAFNTDKQKQTMMERYGVTVPAKNKEIQKKIQETQYENNGGVYAFNTEKQRQTMIERYGGAGSMSSPEVREKLRKTLMERYGYENPMQIPEVKERALKKIVENHGILFGGAGNISKKNILFQESLAELGIESELEKRVGSLFFDLHLTGTNILVDINPTVSHNSYRSFACERTHCGYPCSKHKPTATSYHLNRCKTALSNGYDLIQIFDWDDWDAVIPMIANRIERQEPAEGTWIDLSKTTNLRDDVAYSYTGPLCVWVHYKYERTGRMSIGPYLRDCTDYDLSDEYSRMIDSRFRPIWTPGFAVVK
jgi:vsr/mutH/archaeal HJR family nuclease